MDKLTYEGLYYAMATGRNAGTVNYDKKCDYYTGEVEIDGRIYTYEGDTLEELREDFEDIIDSMLAFEDMEGEDDDFDEDADEDDDNEEAEK